MNKFRKIIDHIVDFKLTKEILSFKNNGYLVELGWYNTLKYNAPIDVKMEPIPWVTYSFIQFIEPYLKKNITLFEYGSGNSTFFFSKRVKEVLTVEHDKNWYNKIQEEKPKNVNLLFCDLNENYPKSVLKYNELFDIVIIDGRKRNECISVAINKIKENGIIVLDDSEREKYSDGIMILSENNFKRIDFWGIAPKYFHNKCTSVFCKDFNSFL